MQGKKLKFLIITAFLIITLFSVTTGDIDFSVTGSHTIYNTMADKPFKFNASPYCYRIFVPLLVYIIPGNSEIAFQIIAYLTITGILLLTFNLLKHYSCEDNIIVVSTLTLLTTFWATRYFIFNPFTVIHASYVMLLAGILAMLKHKNALFLILLLIALFIHESALILIPVFYAYNAKQSGKRKALIKTVKFALLPFLIYTLFRLLSFNAFWGSDIIKSIVYYSGKTGFVGYLVLLVKKSVLTWGIILAVIIAEFPAIYKDLKTQPWIFVLFIFTLILPLFVTGGELLLFYVFPGFILLFSRSLKSLSQRYSVNVKILYILIPVIQLIINYSVMPQSNSIKFSHNITIAMIYSLVIIYFLSLLHAIIIFFKKRKKNHL